MVLFRNCRPAVWILAIPALVCWTCESLRAQNWDFGAKLGESISTQSEGRLKLGFEQRVRMETRPGATFGKDPDCETGLVRTRLSLAYQASKRLKFSTMMQDARSPWYGENAPNSIRDPFDLHEAYVEVLPDGKTGFGMTAGRMMLNYGDGRIIGTPQWGNLSRTYDHARAYYSTPHARIELLVVSPVKVRIGEFNRPVLGDRMWGMYDSFPNFWRKKLLEVYLLRRDQNRPGGFTAGSRLAGTDRLEINTLGFRMAGPLGRGLKFSMEGVAQNGRVGPADHRATAWVSSLGRRWMLNDKPLDLLAEYKFASGSRNPQDPSLSRTFDQLYAANHDRWGHQDLFGWRNNHNIKSLATYGVSKVVALNLMYNNTWLASARDSLYSGSGKAISRSANGSAGRHVGQEADLFVTFKYRHFQWGAGYGRFFAGQFIERTTPGKSPSYAYISQTYSL
jgi:hypothetical protein